MRALFTALPLALLALPAPASINGFESFNGTSFSDPWPTNIAAQGQFRRSEAGELNGDGVPDVVQIVGDRAVVLIDCDQFFSLVEIPGLVSDATVLTGSTATGDAFALVGPSGVQVGSIAPATGAVQLTTVRTGAWLGACKVRRANVDGAGLPDLCVISADQRTVRTLIQTAPLVFADGPSFVALSNVLDALPLEWDGDAAGELALLMQSGLGVFEANGAPRASWTSVLPGGAIARIRNLGFSTDRIAWITAYAPPAQQWLLTLGLPGLEGQLDLGGLDVVAAIGADCDHDGDDDLLLSHRYSYDLMWIENDKGSGTLPALESFDPVRSSKVLFRVGPENVAAPENASWPALADFDGDGDLDIVFASESTRTVQTIRGDWIDENTQRVQLASATYDVVAGHGELALALNAPSAMPSGVNRLQYVVSRRSGASGEIDQVNVAQGELPLPTSWPAALALPIPETSVEFQNVYDVQLRLVTRSSAGALTAIRPTTNVAFTVRTSIANELSQAVAAEFTVPVDLLVPPPALSDCGAHGTQGLRKTRYRVNEPPISSPLAP
jgi:hypothetical protein